jgi:glycosyltransferase involved in cell wall biosynthesis
MSDCEFFNKLDLPDSETRQQIGVNGKFVISYFGALGLSNHLDYFLDIAIHSLRENLNLLFLIIGEGPMKLKLKRRTESSRLTNVHFIDHQNKMDLRRYLSVTDGAYISFANNPVFELNSPNKFFDALASGKMIISNVSGWIRELVELHDCGFYYPPEKPVTFFEKIKPFLDDRAMLNKYKSNARKLAESKFDRRTLTAELLRFIEC